jgi:putative membrane protein
MRLRQHILLYLKGMAMGAADVVPGVSGGTVAFISGIYEELLRSIGAIGPEALAVLRQRGPAAAWRHINGGFLLTLVAGIGTSIVLLVRPITWALEHRPVLIWSFFFGLIAASVPLCARQVKRWGWAPAAGLAIGAALAVGIGIADPAGGAEGRLFFFLAGALAICAMILPGISGSFILLLLGAYAPVMNAIKAHDLMTIGIFALGCLTGLMLFSRLLNWMFTRHHDLTVATMAGFLLGSLTIVWPWKVTVQVRTVHAGLPDERVVPFIQRNVWPGGYGQLNELDALLGITAKEPHTLGAVLLMLGGAALLLFLDRLGPRQA